MKKLAENSTFKKLRSWHLVPLLGWGNRWGKMDTVTDFLFLVPKSLWTVTAAMKLRHLLLGRKAMINLDSILKSRDIILLTNIHRVKLWFFPVAMYRCESWTIKKAECQKN